MSPGVGNEVSSVLPKFVLICVAFPILFDEPRGTAATMFVRSIECKANAASIIIIIYVIFKLKGRAIKLYLNT
jgi:hypothetical protein